MPVKKKKLLLFQLALIAFTLYYVLILYKKSYHLSSVFPVTIAILYHSFYGIYKSTAFSFVPLVQKQRFLITLTSLSFIPIILIGKTINIILTYIWPQKQTTHPAYHVYAGSFFSNYSECHRCPDTRDYYKKKYGYEDRSENTGCKLAMFLWLL